MIQELKARIMGGIFLLAIFFLSSMPLFLVQAASDDVDKVNITDPSFKLLICDGPVLPKNVTPPKTPYVPCDFNGLMMQIQHLINIMIVLGVIAAIGGFSYAGFLYIKGGESDIKKAHEIFPKIFWGFIIMLSAWFIVYQILSWLTGGSYSSLLGS